MIGLDWILFVGGFASEFHFNHMFGLNDFLYLKSQDFIEISQTKSVLL